MELFSIRIRRTFQLVSTDKEIIFDYENNPHTEVEKMTPLEFTARINDEMFNDQDNWVRAIELPEHK